MAGMFGNTKVLHRVVQGTSEVVLSHRQVGMTRTAQGAGAARPTIAWQIRYIRAVTIGGESQAR
jgi:hypothetical protein